MKLISMTDFVLDQFSKLEKTQEINILQFRNNIGNYANFLKQPLKKWMFVPCDLDDNILEEPEHFKDWINSYHYFNASESVTHVCKEYKKAKERVLFKNCKFFKNTDRTIEDMLIYNLELIDSTFNRIFS